MRAAPSARTVVVHVGARRVGDMRKRSVSGIALLVATATVASAGPALGAYPGTNGRIAFERADGFLYSVRPDGTGVRQLGRGASPSYSPDGRRIAFRLGDDVWVMNADGTGRRQVTELGDDSEFDPTWSPDGTRIAFAHQFTVGGGGISSVRSTPPFGGFTRIVRTPRPTDDAFTLDSAPAWATNGLLYFFRETDVNGTLCEDPYGTMVVNPATGAVRNWKFLAMDADPAPRSGAMVYAHAFTDGSCNDAIGIKIADITGADPRAVTPLRSEDLGPPFDGQPVFSPDASRVSFQRGRYLMVATADGSGVRRLVIGSAPSWQPR
jgi:hypothetical protein